jgi:uncharacterized membrane-anchored protein YitT (DUF2179 family)
MPSGKTGIKKRRWLARILIGLVFIFNVECALVFLWAPQNYTASFELLGSTGEAMLRGIGLLFLMWNVPYFFAAWQPIKNRLSVIECLLMQAMGVAGESLILWSLPGVHSTLHTSMLRFIIFDSSGLILLCLAAWITRKGEKSTSEPT